MNVKIYQPSRSMMQSGRAKTSHWVLECDTTSGKKPEPLMGWTASENTLSQIKMSFPTLEAAVAFAKEKGWQFSVAKPRVRRVKPRNYMDNFRYIPGEEV